MFLAPLGAAIVGAGASIAGASAALAPVLTAASAGAGIFNAIGMAKAVSGPPPQLQLPPPVPVYKPNAATQSIIRSNGTKTILTNPLGDTNGSSIIQKKQLVGKLGE